MEQSPLISIVLPLPSAVDGLLMYASAFALVTYGRRTLAPIEVRRARDLGAA